MWKAIPNTNDLYLASDRGEIKRVVGRVSNQPGGLSTREVGGKLLSPKVKSNGYLEVNLQLGDRRNGHSKYVHRLVAEAFLGEIPKGYNVNHKDFDKTNNIISNLEVVTYSQNSKHAFDNGVARPPRYQGSKHPRAKLSEKDIRTMRKHHAKNKDIKALEKLFPSHDLFASLEECHMCFHVNL